MLALDICESLARKQSIVIYTAAGPDDATLRAGSTVFERMQAESSAVIGGLYGTVLRRVAARRRYLASWSRVAIPPARPCAA